MNRVLNYFERRGAVNDSSDDGGGDGEIEAEEDSDDDIEGAYKDENIFREEADFENVYETDKDDTSSLGNIMDETMGDSNNTTINI